VSEPARRAAPARVLISNTELRAAVARLGREVSDTYPEGVVLVGVLKGSVPFLADLVRALTVPAQVDFLALSSYNEGSGRVRILKDLDIDVTARDVLLVEDIIDTGLTSTYLLGVLEGRHPKSVAVCALLDRAARRIVPTPVRFVGFEIPDEFVLGYGLDYAERYRNLDEVVAGDLAALRADADAHVRQLFPE
jgi:hypoxanthine phosphoribosyltransferase